MNEAKKEAFHAKRLVFTSEILLWAWTTEWQCPNTIILSDVHKDVFIDVHKDVFMSFKFWRVCVDMKKIVVASNKQRN